VWGFHPHAGGTVLFGGALTSKPLHPLYFIKIKTAISLSNHFRISELNGNTNR